MEEIWKAVPGYGGHYEASSLGRIRSNDRWVEQTRSNTHKWLQLYPEKILSPKKFNRDGYIRIGISVGGKKFSISAHTFVLLAFTGPPEAGHEALHMNGIPSDNRPDNLRWGTQLENAKDRILHGTCPRGSTHGMSYLTEDQVIAIRASTRKGVSLAAEYGVTQTTISDIRSGRTWKHLLIAASEPSTH